MKFKAVVSDNAPRELVEALDGLRSVVEREVACDCFKTEIGSMKGAELYVQACDSAKSPDLPFIAYHITHVTWKEERDFETALRTMERILKTQVDNYWASRKEKVQIMVSIATTQELYESEAILV